jgi:hypothetical protein
MPTKALIIVDHSVLSSQHFSPILLLSLICKNKFIDPCVSSLLYHVWNLSSYVHYVSFCY